MTLRRFGSARRQRGIVMWVALGVLIIMSLAGLAMLRQMSGGLSIAGNVAFKQSATSVADLGSETARAWLLSPGSVLSTDNVSAGYYSSWGGSVDPRTFPWSTAPVLTDAATGNTVRYIVHRLCDQAGLDANAPGQHCSAVGSRPPGRGGEPGFSTVIAPFFRITTQVSGPRNTVSYTQVVTN